MKGRFVWIDGMRIFFLEFGSPKVDAPVLLFLHGWGLSAQAFQRSLKALGSRFRVIAPDLPNFGRSSFNPGLSSYQHYAAALEQLLELLDINKVHVVGHSMGGAIAIRMAAAYPQRIASLMLANSAGLPVRPRANLALSRTREVIAQLFDQSKVGLNWDFTKALLYNLCTKRSRLLHTIWTPMTEDIRPHLQQVQCPCLLA